MSKTILVIAVLAGAVAADKAVMRIPEYVAVSEVQRVCDELGLRDWSKIKDEVTEAETRIIVSQLDTTGVQIDLKDFQKGLEIELEHGRCFKEANVTNNHPVLTGKIVLAHLKEFEDYYKRLEVMELEGDLHKATVRGEKAKLPRLHRELAEARLVLRKSEAAELVK